MIERLECYVKNMGSCSIVYNNGSNAEVEPRFRGMTHILEHCLCDDLLTKYKKRFERNGIEFNASTSERGMVFYIEGLSKKINYYMKEFIEAVLNKEIDRELFEKQKKIIAQENRGLITDPNHVIYFNFKRKFYNNYSTIGEVEKIEELKYEDLLEYKKRYFSKPSKICLMLPKRIKTIFDKGYVVECDEEERKYEYELKEDGYSDVKMIEAPKSGMVQLMMYFNFKTADDYKNRAYYIMMKELMPFFEVVREKLGLVYWINDTFFENGKENSTFVVETMTSSENVEKVKKAIVNLYKKICAKKISKKNFEFKKNQLVLQEKIARNVSYNSVSFFNEDQKRIFEHIKGMTVDDLNKFREEVAAKQELKMYAE